MTTNDSKINFYRADVGITRVPIVHIYRDIRTVENKKIKIKIQNLLEFGKFGTVHLGYSCRLISPGSLFRSGPLKKIHLPKNCIVSTFLYLWSFMRFFQLFISLTLKHAIKRRWTTKNVHIRIIHRRHCKAVSSLHFFSIICFFVLS